MTLEGEHKFECSQLSGDFNHSTTKSKKKKYFPTTPMTFQPPSRLLGTPFKPKLSRARRPPRSGHPCPPPRCLWLPEENKTKLRKKCLLPQQSSRLLAGSWKSQAKNLPRQQDFSAGRFQEAADLQVVGHLPKQLDTFCRFMETSSLSPKSKVLELH